MAATQLNLGETSEAMNLHAPAHHVGGEVVPSDGPAKSGLRRDIQGLRTIAVLAVLLYHFWPRRLTGGYVGVDIFFVISGFLITAHLLQRPPTTRRALLSFWGRRVRRLLPVAGLVLLVTLGATFLWLPETMWRGTALEAAFAAVYSENWYLASLATDYLAAEGAPSPIQHYWSLSVEEQFYIIWPLLIGAIFVASPPRRREAALVLGLSGVFVASLGWSVWLTATDPSSAYFVTPTRMWELAIGGLVALAAHIGVRVTHGGTRLILSWGGLALIGVSLLAFDHSTPFPSWTALIPTVGTALVIFAGTDDLRWSADPVFSWRWVQHIGLVSYSVYLWHWPAITIGPYVVGEDLRWPTKVVLALAVIGLATLSTRFVEDPVRDHPALRGNLGRTFAVGALTIVAVLLVSFAMVTKVDRTVEAQRSALEQAEVDNPECFGAAAARHDQCQPYTADLVMDPTMAAGDKSVLYADECWNNRPYDGRTVCHYGADRDSASAKIALLGNSHAGQWSPILIDLAREKGWSLDTYLVSECYTVDIPLDFGVADLAKNCTAWNAWAVDTIAEGGYDLVVMSNRSFRPPAGVPAKDRESVTAEAYARTIRAFTDRDVDVLVFRDTPAAGRNAPDCVAAHPGDWATACTYPAKKALEPDPLFTAAKAMDSGAVSTIDVTSTLCRQDTCHSVVGGLVAYFDHGHLTQTFARTLIPYVSSDVVAAVDAATR